jgi:hypothetical protein
MRAELFPERFNIVYEHLHRETIMVAPQIEWLASIEKDSQCLSQRFHRRVGTAAYFKGELSQMKQIKYAALLSMLALLSSVSALARDKNQHSVQIPNSVQVGGTQLQPGNYKVEWQGTGPQIKVNFVRDGKTVATALGTLKTNDAKVTQDDIVTDTTSANIQTLTEIDFRRTKESLVFEQSGM